MIIELREHGPAQDVPRLPDEVCQALAPLVRVSASGPRHSRLRPGAKVGVLRAGEVTVHVEPKLGIAQLLFLVGYAKKPVAWRDPLAEVEEISAGLGATVADVFARLAEHAMARGALQGYQPRTASMPVLKGRLRLADHLRARSGMPFPFEVTYPVFGPDIAENRILKAAAMQTLRLPRLRPDSRMRLGRIVRQLTAASVLSTAQQPLTWHPTRLNVHYHAALRMGELILRGSSFGPAPGPMPTCGFVLDLDVVFQNFVCTALGEALSVRVAGTWRAPHQTYLDVAREVPINPDFAYLVNGEPVAVADAKYKHGGRRVPEDIYQMVVYCTALGLPRGHLVYAEGSPEPVAHEIRRGGVQVVRHALDLSQRQGPLLAAIDRLAGELIADIGSVRPTGHPSPRMTRVPGGRA
jgi:5-methylcytosine-specific restriction enzyme subunit McrC